MSDSPSPASVLSAVFDEEQRARLRGNPETAITIEPTSDGESAAWISLRAFGCARSKLVDPAECEIAP